MEAAKLLGAIVLVLVGAAIGNLVNAALDRSPPLAFIEAYAASATAPIGGPLEIRFDVDRRRICQVVRVQRWIKASDGVEYNIGTYTLSSTTRPGRERYDRTIQIPSTMPPGPATYRIRIQYACNFFHALGWPITVESPPVNFLAIQPNGGFPSVLTPLPGRLFPGKDG